MSSTTLTRYSNLSPEELQLRRDMYEAIDGGLLNKVGMPLLNVATRITGIENDRLPLRLLKRGTEAVALKVLDATAVEVFFGGLNLEETAVTVGRNFAEGYGAIIDFCASEDVKHAGPETFDAVRDEYLAGVARAARLNRMQASYLSDSLPGMRKQGTEASVAVKLSTLASFGDLVRWSELLEAKREGKILSQQEADSLAGYDMEIGGRAERIFAEAKQTGVRVYLDAEYTSINPAIHHVAKTSLAKGYDPTLTIQAYLKDAPQLVNEALGWDRVPDIKLVRGAYLGDPKEDQTRIWETKAQTDACYNQSLERLFHSGRVGHITAATHNTHSQDLAEELSKTPGAKTQICVAKLRGIGDSLIHRLTLPVQEYVPYGGLGGIAYLSRRGVEMMDNGGKTGDSRARQEIAAIDADFARRGVEPRRTVGTVVDLVRAPQHLQERLKDTRRRMAEQQKLDMGI